MLRVSLFVLGLLVSAASNAEPILIQTKSFIAQVNLLDKTQFADDASCKQSAMAAFIDCAMLFGENPKKGDATSGDFRLHSELTGQAKCAGDQVASWSLQPVSVSAGTELYFLATQGDLSPALTATPGKTGSTVVARVAFSYRMLGAPNGVGITAMKKVKSRSCSMIWHKIDGELLCRGGKLKVSYDVRASAFPSVRSWNSGKLTVDRTQGPFKSLWECDPTEPNLVR